MDSTQGLRADKQPEPRPQLSGDAIATILWESFWNALIRAFLVQVLGGVAISLLGDVFRQMEPSLPPVFNRKPAAEAAPPPTSHAVRTFLAHDHFWLIFGIIFLAITATRLARYSRNQGHRTIAARLLQINRRISGRWFSLFVLNALTAWISTLIVIALQRFSWTQILWVSISAILQPVFQAVASLIPGSGSFGRWYSWYAQNQAKFLFWLLYSAAICDDLGLPNYKTLIRWGGRRLKSYIRFRLGFSVTDSPKRSVSGERLS